MIKAVRIIIPIITISSINPLPIYGIGLIIENLNIIKRKIRIFEEIPRHRRWPPSSMAMGSIEYRQ